MRESREGRGKSETVSGHLPMSDHMSEISQDNPRHRYSRACYLNVQSQGDSYTNYDTLTLWRKYAAIKMNESIMT